MDFEDLTSSNLRLQAVWSTGRGWQRDMYEDEIRKVPRHGEHILYFCLEEFVLTGKQRGHVLSLTSSCSLFVSAVGAERLASALCE